jgi:drug/metabolite transporter (DMT)-like permease
LKSPDNACRSYWQGIFSHPIYSVLLALFSCALLGSLYPFVKIGYAAFQIAGNDVPSILLFAGLRFALCGIITVPLFSVTSKEPLLSKRSDISTVLWVALFSIVLHYAFTYLALAVGQSAKSAIIKQVGFLFLSCFSFLFVKKESFSPKKPICGVLGFVGIIVTSFDGGFDFAIGDALIVAASLCSAISTILTKNAVERVSAVKLVAYSQLIGGAFLCVCGVLAGGRLSHFDLRALLVMLYICAASVIAYMVWNVCVKYNSVSKLAVIRFSVPLFAVAFSGILLKEQIFKWNYVLSLSIILVAILLNEFSWKKNARL